MADASARIMVPAAKVAAEAYRAVFGQLGLWFDLAWLPLLVLLAAALIPGYLHLYFGWHGFPRWAGNGYGLGIENLIEAVAGLLALNAFAVRWYQRLLFSGDRRIPDGLFLGAWGRFLLYTVLLYLVSAGLFASLLVADAADLPVFVAPVAGVIAALVWLGTLRCSLLFPAAACGKPMALGAAWRAMRGNSWRLLGCGIVACAPAALIVIVILSGIFAGLHLDTATDRVPLGFFLLRGIIGACANFVIVALGAAVLSGFYRRIMVRGLRPY